MKQTKKVHRKKKSPFLVPFHPWLALILPPFTKIQNPNFLHLPIKFSISLSLSFSWSPKLLYFAV